MAITKRTKYRHCNKAFTADDKLPSAVIRRCDYCLIDEEVATLEYQRFIAEDKIRQIGEQIVVINKRGNGWPKAAKDFGDIILDIIGQ